MNKSTAFCIAVISLFLLTLATLIHTNDGDILSLSLASTAPVNVNGFLLPQSLPLARVEFTATHPSLVSTEGFKNNWTLLAIGYTQCPDICPTTLLKLDRVLTNIPLDERPRVAFLSIDIGADEIAKLAAYMQYFNQDFIGLSTTPEQLDNFFQSLGASYRINKNPSGTVDIEHSSAVFLISPEQRYVAIFPYLLTAEQISNDFLTITR